MLSQGYTRREIFVVSTFGFLMFCSFLFYDNVENNLQAPQPMADLLNQIAAKSPAEETQRHRLERITSFCRNQGRQNYERSYKQTYAFRASKLRYNFDKFEVSYCKVPKVGCTFMMEMFQILLNGNTTLYEQSRTTVHTKTYKYQGKQYLYPVITNVRDPYTRLYSGYVDKILLPNFYQAARTIRADHSTNKSEYISCANDVTFQEFLDYVITEARSTAVMNRHWTPIYGLCGFCDINNSMIIKQEHFTEGIRDFVQSLNIPKETLNAVNSLMGERRIETTIPGIVKVVLSRQYKLKGCMSRLQALEKLWLSFQIQGYISENMEFPETELKDKVIKETDKFFCNFMVEAAKTSNLTSVESKRQRKRYLVSAYKSIEKKTIDEIKHIFWTDFTMFNYDMNPPE